VNESKPLPSACRPGYPSCRATPSPTRITTLLVQCDYHPPPLGVRGEMGEGPARQGQANSVLPTLSYDVILLLLLSLPLLLLEVEVLVAVVVEVVVVSWWCRGVVVLVEIMTGCPFACPWNLIASGRQ